MSSYRILDETDEDYDILNRTLSKEYLWVGDKNVFMFAEYWKLRNDIKNFQVRANDIWIMSYPKSGTTWTEEMVWCIMNGLNSDELSKPIMERVSFLEQQPFCRASAVIPKIAKTTNCPIFYKSVQVAAEQPSPRIIKTHLRWHMLPDQIQKQSSKPKIIYVYRNPMDVCVSFFNHSRLLENYPGGLDDFCSQFIKNKVPYGSIFDHIEDFIQHSKESNFLFITYEEMKEHLPNVISKVATFLEKSLSEEEISQLSDHLSFQKMKNNPAVNMEEAIRKRQAYFSVDAESGKQMGKFMNKGRVGYYKEMMPVEYQKVLKKLCDDFERKTGIKFQS